MKLPNFLLIGAGKAGTTALYEYLNQHPQIYMSPVKEPNFFAFMGEEVGFRGPGEEETMNKSAVTDFDTYKMLFKAVTTEKAIGEASHWYLYSPLAADRIKQYLPDVKLIAILRDPVKRAYSDFLHFVRDQQETHTDFLEAVSDEEERVASNWAFGHYIRRGLYYEQIKRYFDRFERAQLAISLTEDLKADSITLMQNIFQFLEVDNTFVPDVDYKPNVSGIPQNKALHSFLSKSNPLRKIVEPIAPIGLRKFAIRLQGKNIFHPPLTPEIRQQLIPLFREDILKLQDLIQRDLSNWLK